jgi:hypothetical protein
MTEAQNVLTPPAVPGAKPAEEGTPTEPAD